MHNILDEKVKSLGFDIVQLHLTDMSTKFSHLIKTFTWLPEYYQNTLITLHHNKYFEIPSDLCGEIGIVSLTEIKNILKISDFHQHDERFYVTIHKKLFSFIVNFIAEQFDLIADVKFRISSKPSYSFVKIYLDIEFMIQVISPTDIDKAVAYMKLIDEIPPQTQPAKELEYLMPLKSMINLFGGKLNVCNVIDDVKLSFEMLLPRRKHIEQKTKCQH
jgi:hypothetical protein